MKLTPVLLALLLLPAVANAGVFLGMDQELVDPQKGEKPTLIVSFDEKLYRAHLTVTAEGGFKQEWAIPSVTPGKDLRYTWKAPRAGEVQYDIAVLMVRSDGSKETLEDIFFCSSASPITATIPPLSVDLETRSFDLVTNHKPAYVEMKVISDTMDVLGEGTVDTADAADGKVTRVTWPQEGKGNVLRVTVIAHDAFGYYSEVEIIPWSLTIPHEDVIFPTGSHEILAEEAPKADKAWTRIVDADKKYNELVKVTLYIGGYTDTVGDAGSNQALSQRRAKALAAYFKAKGSKIDVFYQGFGESVLAKPTGDGVDEAANRRAVYVLTAGPPPRSKETPRGNWSKL
ncbi:MAG: OmpA family protein [Deltaproteobacteria bacterium]|nr:OmpA family protein [Deltaproteobacteria bacterium]